MKTVLKQFYTELFPENKELTRNCDENICWHVSAPIDALKGLEKINRCFVSPLKAELKSIEDALVGEQNQGPFGFNLPDRAMDHYATFIAEGNYAATGGWPHMQSAFPATQIEKRI